MTVSAEEIIEAGQKLNAILAENFPAVVRRFFGPVVFYVEDLQQAISLNVARSSISFVDQSRQGREAGWPVCLDRVARRRRGTVIPRRDHHRLDRAAVRLDGPIPAEMQGGVAARRLRPEPAPVRVRQG